MQYLAPTMIFLIGLFIFKEPFNQLQFIAFVFIWVAVALYTWSGISQARKAQTAPASS
jgi:chloramphenicol-sensitive protein RarD